ncbi:MAG: hypothetical protein WEB00_13405 [Dehalococcoidia bacterium]
MIDDLQRDFDIQLHRWPHVVGGPNFPSEWRGLAASVSPALKPGMHVLATGGVAITALIAMDQRTDCASLIAESMLAPAATLRAFGLHEAAAGVEGTAQIMSRGYPGIISRLIMQGASEAEQADLAASIQRDSTEGGAFGDATGFHSLNLLADPPQLKVPALYLDSLLPIAGYAEMADLFKRFAPDAEVGHLEIWPVRVQDAAAGHELAGLVRAFIAGLDTT